VSGLPAIAGSSEAAPQIERALEFTREHELGGYVQYLLGMRAILRLRRGDWTGAERDARASFEHGIPPGVTRIPALVALGSLQARRGDLAARDTLDEAWERARAMNEVQSLAPAAAARLELGLLAGGAASQVAEARDVYERAVRRAEPWTVGELAFRLWLAGELSEPPSSAAEPYRRAMAGDWAGAAAAWEEMGRPYDAAEARSLADDDSTLLQALAEFDRLGAVPAAVRLRRRLRERGVRAVPRGPRPATRALPRGLTPRQHEVLSLIAAGATNAEIAERLVISAKTVDHHVSAVLGKLEVASRREAADAARALGITGDQDRERPSPR
jgi:ATP/maltotriose-dependent transcriptional regulator MalT